MTNEYYLKALSAELSSKELDEALKCIYEMHENDAWTLTGDFYLPEVYISVCMKKLRGEIDDDYFKTWLIIVCNSVDPSHGELWDCFDGWSWNDSFSELDCRNIISTVRDYDLKFRHRDFVKYHKKNKMTVIYLRWEMLDHSTDNVIYKCYLVDHKRKLYDIRIADDSIIDYDLSKNYCTVVDEEWLEYIRRQKENDGEEIDCSKPQKQFCEAEEELIDIFYEDDYVRDKSLEL